MRQYIRELVDRIDNTYATDSVDMSLGDWICANTHLRSRSFTFDRYPFQKQIADDIHPNMDVVKPSQVGLALSIDTPVATPEGWSTMGALEVGDTVFAADGSPTTVSYVSPVYRDHECYEIEFDTGETVVADAGHRWFVQGHKAFNETDLCFQTGRIPQKSDFRREGVVTTEMLFRNHKHKGRSVFAIPNAKPLQTKSEALPLDPYVLGLWLGDGSSASATLTCHIDDYPHLKAAIEPWGYSLSPLKGYSTRILWNGEVHQYRDSEFDPDTAKVHARLRELNLIKNKHIPPQYLRAHEADRRALLQGLLDTDGSITKNGRVSFYNCDIQLVAGVQELMGSLGLKSRTRWRPPSPGTLKNGHQIKSKQPIAEVSCMAYAADDLFRLPRKKERLKSTGRTTETYRRRIISVRPVQTQPVRCIQVDHPSHLFLCGRGMIPTHNTEVQIRKALAFLHRNRGTSLIFTLPNDDMYERMSKGRIMPIVRDEKVFNLGDEKVTRSKGLMQIGSSFLYVTGAKEGDATSISADVVFNDEIDLTNQQMLGLFNSRLQNSDWKINQRFSTPTFYGFGVDAGFQASDQHEYMCKCDACNHWNIPVFEQRFIDIPGLPDSTALLEIDNTLVESGRLDLRNAEVVCEKCRAPLDLGRTEAREWVARYASRSHHRGYRVSPFSTNRLSVEYIVTQLLQYRRRDYLRGFHNTVLGQAYTAGAAQLNDSEIDACFTPVKDEPALDPVLPTWIGIDVGKTCHLIVSQGFTLSDQKIVRWKTLPPEKMLEEVKILNEQCNVVGGACDRHPYTPTAEAARDITNGKVLPVEYRGQKMINLVKDELDDKITHAQVNRTGMIDGFVKMIRMKGVHFMGYLEQRGTIKEHLKDMVRDEQPEKPATWIKLHGNDHYFHAGAFLYAAIKLKELEYGKYTDQRGTVLVSSASLGQPSLGLNQNRSKAFLGL